MFGSILGAGMALNNSQTEAAQSSELIALRSKLESLSKSVTVNTAGVSEVQSLITRLQALRAEFDTHLQSAEECQCEDEIRGVRELIQNEIARLLNLLNALGVRVDTLNADLSALKNQVDAGFINTDDLGTAVYSHTYDTRGNALTAAISRIFNFNYTVNFNGFLRAVVNNLLPDFAYTLIHTGITALAQATARVFIVYGHTVDSAIANHPNQAALKLVLRDSNRRIVYIGDMSYVALSTVAQVIPPNLRGRVGGKPADTPVHYYRCEINPLDGQDGEGRRQNYAPAMRAGQYGVLNVEIYTDSVIDNLPLQHPPTSGSSGGVGGFSGFRPPQLAELTSETEPPDSYKFWGPNLLGDVPIVNSYLADQGQCGVQIQKTEDNIPEWMYVRYKCQGLPGKPDADFHRYRSKVFSIKPAPNIASDENGFDWTTGDSYAHCTFMKRNIDDKIDFRLVESTGPENQRPQIIEIRFPKRTNIKYRRITQIKWLNYSDLV